MSLSLFEHICDFENIHRAYKRASAARHYRDDIILFTRHIEDNLLALRDELKSGAYVHGEYRHFIAQDSKKREIMAAPFKDRIMHHALHGVIEPLFDARFIYDSYACRPEKGTHRAVKRLRQFLRRVPYEQAYIFQGDIVKYFSSIHHETLLALAQRTIHEPLTMRLIETVVRSAHAQRGTGIPIGNLTSQLFANMYLNELDQFVKHILRAKHYIRYMDDFLILDTDKHLLAEYRTAIAEHLETRLRLTMHERKSTIAPVRLGVGFLGYRIFKDTTRLRTSTVKRFTKRIRYRQKQLARGTYPQDRFDSGVASWQAYAKHANAWQLRRILGERLGVELL